MPPTHPWLFDEYQDFGWASADEIETYERRAGSDPAAERELLQRLGLSADDTLIDFGSGTGVLVIEAARMCRRVIAIDPSAPMLEYSRSRSEAAGIGHIEYVHCGFLTYEHQGPPADFAVSRHALHHLPDFWKVRALHNVARSLRPGGTFYLHDVMFSFEPDDIDSAIDVWIDQVASETPPGFAREFFEEHVRREYSTYTWLLEAMLRRAGLEITHADYRLKAYASYTCRRL